MPHYCRISSSSRRQMSNSPSSLTSAAPPCGLAAKIGREDVENATHAPLACFGSAFRLFWD